MTRVIAADYLVRFHQVGFVALWPLLGLVAGGDWSARAVIGIVVVALCFNTFGVILDDVVHLESDRTEPLKANSLLVRGVLSPVLALVIALGQLPLMVTAHLLAGFSDHSLLLLAGAVCGLTLYNVYGKRCPIPPLVESAEAFAAALLVVYGAAVNGDAFHQLVPLLALSAFVYILLINGFHGSLRDIDNELRHNLSTTPIWFGCTGFHDGRIHITRRMSVYSLALLSGFVALSSAVLTHVDRIAPRSSISFSLMWLVALVLVGGLALLHRLPRPWWDLALRCHGGALPLPLILALTPLLSATRVAIVLLVYLVPLLMLPLRVLASPDAAARSQMRLPGSLKRSVYRGVGQARNI